MEVRFLISFASLAVAAAMSGGAEAATIYDTSLAAPGVYFGSGNGGTNHGWTVNTENNVELGLVAIQRGVDSINPTSTNIYNVQTGQSSPGRAWWNFDFSINLRNGGGTLTLGDVTPTIYIHDYLNNTSVSLNPFTSFGDNSAYNGSGTRNGNVSGQQATAADFGAQNSENLTFGQFVPLGFDDNANDTYLITLSLLGPDNVDLGSVSEYVVAGAGVATTPIPASLPLFTGGLGIVGLLARRRKQKAQAAA